MPFSTTTHFVAKAVPGPGQRLVHGRIVGPTDETYPPGTGGALPRPSTINHVVTKIVTVRDTSSGHTRTVRSVYVMGTDPEEDKVAHRAMLSHGSSIAFGRPVESETAPDTTTKLAEAENDATAHHIGAEDQHQMDAHYSRLTRPEQLEFLEAYPNYVPGLGAVEAPAESVIEGASVEEAPTATTQTQEGPKGEVRTTFVAPKAPAAKK